MMKRFFKSRVLPVLVAVALLVPWWAVSGELEDERVRQAAGSESLLRSLQPGEFFGTVAAGGFRAMVIDYLWMRATLLERRKDYYQLRATYELLARLQPRAESVWQFNAMNLAYNIAAEYHTPASRYHWVTEGIKLNRRGLQFVPDSLELRYQMAFFLFHCFSYDDNPFSRDFRRLLRLDPPTDFIERRNDKDPIEERLYKLGVRTKSPVAYALWYLYCTLHPPERFAKWHKSHLVYLNIIFCCDVLLRESEVALREARLDMLKAREALIFAGGEDRQAAQQMLELRKREMKEVESGKTAPRLTGSETELLERLHDAYLPIFEEAAPELAAGLMSFNAWHEAAGVMLNNIDDLLNLYKRALDEQDSSEIRKVITDAEFKSLKAGEVQKMLESNASYIAPLHKETVWRVSKYVREETGEEGGGN